MTQDQALCADRDSRADLLTIGALWLIPFSRIFMV
jgi:hypothetical protein